VSDRELLKLAAKAAGIDADVTEWSSAIQDDEGDYLKPWNPLTDDGDALRLAVELKMDLIVHERLSSAAVEDGFFRRHEQHNDDPYAATRRAITRAAAEIGRNMK
jgi:hypothetical protein